MVHNIIIKKKNTTTTFECTPISNGLWNISMCTSETFSSALHKIDIDRRHRIALNAINKVDSFEITALQLPTSAASHLATHLHDYELGSGHHHVAHRLPSPWIPHFLTRVQECRVHKRLKAIVALRLKLFAFDCNYLFMHPVGESMR